MLRLAEGWSAARLSQEYEGVGPDSLARPTIAKIESDRRPIRAGEVEGVAQVFGVTSADLLDPAGPRVFLSYADQDLAIGREVSDWLAGRGFRVVSGAGEDAIDDVDAFVALLSPDFSSSSRCQGELATADRRRRQLAATGSRADFIYALRIAEVPAADTPDSEPYPLIELEPASLRAKEVSFSKLGRSIIIGSRASAGQLSPQAQVPTEQTFVERGEELERILYGLGSPAGPHFWLLIGPPGLGKSTFITQLMQGTSDPAPGNWVKSKLDLSHDEAGLRGDAMAVVRRLIGIDETPASTIDDELLAIAQKIIFDGRPRLWVLDGAEFLSGRVVNELRQHLGAIYTLIKDSGSSGHARLAFVAASYRDDGWKGEIPYPAPVILPLETFSPGIVQEALEGLAQRMSLVRSPAELRHQAALITQFSEGVPLLVQETLHWIEAQQWLKLNRLEERQVFEDIVSPYIVNELLAPESLRPEEDLRPGTSKEQLTVLVDAVRVLAPYRFFTQYYLTANSSFLDSLNKSDWKTEDLWRVLAGTPLLKRPFAEAWYEIHPAIRRLLYEYFYPEDERAKAHREAGEVTRRWAGLLPGRDQINGMVEAIWHQAAYLRLSGVTSMERDLTEFARELSRNIVSDPYTKSELRDYAAQRMRNDDELQREIADFDGLFDKLVRSFLEPGPQEA